jgi:hypothetical protein
MNTNKLVPVLFAIAAIGSGCGTDVKSSASGVFPAQGFAGRSLRVEISGDQTNWKDGATVSFGSGITVSSVEVASPTDLFADIAIDPSATIGKADVTVMSGGTFTLKQAFEVTSPIEVQFTGDATQGALPAFKIINLDFDNPFDTTSATDPTTGAMTYPNLTITGPAGVDFSSPLVGGFTPTAYEIDGFALMDVDAMSGDLTVKSGAGSAAVTSTITGGVTVTPRSATALTPGTPATGMIAALDDSALFSIPAGSGSPELARLDLTSTDANAQPTVALLGSSGHWSDFISAGAPYAFLPNASSLYAIVFDGGSEAAYTVNVTAHADAVTTAAEGNDTTNGTDPGALAASALPFEQTGGTLSSASDVDEISFTVTAAEVSSGHNHAHILTDIGSDPATDTAVEVVDAQGNAYTDDGFGGSVIDGSQCSLFGCSSLGEDTVTKALPAGTYYLKVTAGQQYSTADKAYDALIWLE